MPGPETPRRHWTAGALALVVIGLLILIPSGLCTTVVGGGAVLSMVTEESFSGLALLAIAIAVGGPFIALGAALVRGGLRARDGN